MNVSYLGDIQHLAFYGMTASLDPGHPCDNGKSGVLCPACGGIEGDALYCSNII